MNEHVTAPKTERLREGVTLTDARPLRDIPAVWRLAGLVATLGMFVVAMIGGLYLGRAILVPVVAGIIMGITLIPAVKFGCRAHLPPFAAAPLVVLALVIAILLLLTFVAAPLTEWIGRAPEIAGVVKQRLSALDYPLSIFRELRTVFTGSSALTPTVSMEPNPAEIFGQVLLVVTPAVGQFVVFFGTLIFFLVSSTQLRDRLVTSFVTRDGRLRMLRIWNDIEENLIGYLGTVTVINAALGAITALMLFLVGFPNPLSFGLLTFALNYIPYIGPAIIALVLFCVGLVAMPSLGWAAVAPALFVGLATLEGHFITPSIIGRRLTLNPFLVFLALCFWTWIWGAIGAFLAVPLLIVSLVVLGHLIPREETALPG
jgi:predicted PurR-regulated permease PerM